jgi:hypothetical protein
MNSNALRRIVTGHDGEGNAIIQEDGAPPRIVRIGGEIGPLFHEVWNTQETPARIDRASGEPAEAGIQLAPPKQGTRIRVLDIRPKTNAIGDVGRRSPSAFRRGRRWQRVVAFG